MKFSIKITIQTLHAINKLWALIEFEDNLQGKTDRSICEFVAQKMLKKQFSKIGKPADVEFKIEFLFFEAIAIERALRVSMYRRYEPGSSELNSVMKFVNELNQKCA